jgi:hypothetical protein
MAGKSPKPSEEETASDERRANARQGVLRDVLARSKGSTSMTRTGALEQINKERIDAGMPPMEFSNAEFAADDQARAEKRYEEAGRAGRSRVVKSMYYEDFGLDPVETSPPATAATPKPPAPTTPSVAPAPSRPSPLRATPTTRSTPLRQLAFTTAEARKAEEDALAKQKRDRSISELREQRQRTKRASDASIDKSWMRDTLIGDILKGLSTPIL